MQDRSSCHVGIAGTRRHCMDALWISADILQKLCIRGIGWLTARGEQPRLRDGNRLTMTLLRIVLPSDASALTCLSV